MDLLNPDVGDVLDRITILHLKLARQEEVHWRDELNRLYACPGLGERMDVRVLRPILELFAKNAVIWQATDEVDIARNHVARGAGPEVGWEAEQRFALTHTWNKDRSALVQGLNDSLGRGAKREKV